ncbi:hypothetical protein AZI87_16865 [Bdellovibrio bacteriovorus]|uniref:Glyoxalase/fosfomycin resistance/dioxygenase domain-containing protein n=1 Tax=Bdellovibrio bacteriovorus TaxID=959 RepID=A0A162G0A9_BDEBC|nr:VOC family protein [Bdellovibrio bacteriovorus]KYG62933.1 hypothetical protein AZI87_16865 [Bdellovibrio bacteriovorus]
MRINGVPQNLYSWYQQNLGLMQDSDGAFVIPSERLLANSEPVSFFPYDTSYFSPSNTRNLFNFQVDNLAALLTSMAENGVRIDDRIEETEHGLFAWVYDPEGNRIELWEPAHHKETLINLPEAE